ncbi:hypothetical protein SAMN04488058_1194 [Deinococcus reticulitermitis]|uniref:Prevent-host-death family protein n=1 Tax=Deinococcus reticulitermitis TaxID=856736 RepID=A0A1H7BQ78_9DEIO|nr:hypothetical protein [Deinococcus reticulitermitis]SEJ79346.1 hypothetical protein SAMN04488058_1194 [Deinococcus reticulitermitis]
MTTTKAAMKKLSPQPKPVPAEGLPARVGVKEFRDQATRLLARGAPFAVERHGKVIGLYTPLTWTPEQQARVEQAAQGLDATLAQVARDLGLSVEDLEEVLVGDLP